MSPTPPPGFPPPCPTPVCVETTAPDGTVSVVCSSIAIDGCCSSFVPNVSTWEIACASPSGPGGPTAVPAVEPAGLLLSAALIAAAALPLLRRR